MARRGPTARTPRLALGTTLGGLAGVGVGFGAAWGPALATDYECNSPDSSDFCGIDTVIILASATWATPDTTALGIWAGGRPAGGRGNYGITLLGSAIGGTIGGGVATLSLLADRRSVAIAGFLNVPILEWVGGVIAYHLSHNARRNRGERRMLPTVQAQRGGASLALVGTF